MPGLFEKDMPEANRVLVQQLNRISAQLNALTEGHLHAVHNAYTAAPTGGEWAQGDFIRKSDPVEAGGAGSKYVIVGWICTVGGSPGTWLECRVLTGN
jgi:hypothetical protein